MSHTKGKWLVDPMDYNECLEIVVEGGGVIAQVYGKDEDSYANANLIVAAPEMLEMVKEIVQYVEGNGLDKMPKEEACAEYFTCTLYYHFAKDLLAKAEGK